jgi:hypothetical protein
MGISTVILVTRQNIATNDMWSRVGKCVRCKKKRSEGEGVFYELYTVMELISHAASGFVLV